MRTANPSLSTPSARRPRRRPPRRARPRVVLACALAALAGPHCSSEETTHFSSEQDAEVIEAFEGTWEAEGADGPFTLEVCESPDPPAPQEECGTVHVVRGRGLGKTEDVNLEPVSSGCGECEARADAYFVGTLRLPDGASYDVKGTAQIVGSVNVPNPYEPPYPLRLSWYDAADPYSIQTPRVSFSANGGIGEVLREARLSFSNVPYAQAGAGGGAGGGAGAGGGRPGAAGEGGTRPGPAGQGGAAGPEAGAGGAAGGVAGAGGGAGGESGAGGEGSGAAGAQGGASGAAGAAPGEGDTTNDGEAAAAKGRGAGLALAQQAAAATKSVGPLVFRRVGPADCSAR